MNSLKLILSSLEKKVGQPLKQRNCDQKDKPESEWELPVCGAVYSALQSCLVP